MIDNKAKNREAVKKMADGIRFAFFLSLITNAYDIYSFINLHGQAHQGFSIVFGILGTILIWQLSQALRSEKKHALYYWLALLAAGYVRWIFVDDAFNVNMLSIGLLFLGIALTLRIANWMRKGVLT